MASFQTEVCNNGITGRVVTIVEGTTTNILGGSVKVGADLLFTNGKVDWTSRPILDWAFLEKLTLACGSKHNILVQVTMEPADFKVLLDDVLLANKAFNVVVNLVPQAVVAPVQSVPQLPANPAMFRTLVGATTPTGPWPVMVESGTTKFTGSVKHKTDLYSVGGRKDWSVSTLATWQELNQFAVDWLVHNLTLEKIVVEWPDYTALRADVTGQNRFYVPTQMALTSPTKAMHTDFSAKPATKKCTCGAAKCGSSIHSGWCDAL